MGVRRDVWPQRYGCGVVIDPETAAGLQRISAAAQNTLSVTTIWPHQADALFRDAENGCANSLKIMEATLSVIHKIELANPPITCLCCGVLVPKARCVTVVLAHAGLDCATEMAGYVVCVECAQTPDVNACIKAALEAVWGNLKKIAVHSAAGRA
jgi:hypothetical protein